MTDFSKAFYNIVADNVRDGDERIRQNMMNFSCTYEEARAIDEALMSASRTVGRVIGHKLDSLPDHLKVHGLRLVVGSIGLGLESLQTIITMFNEDLPVESLGILSDPNCECDACTAHKALRTQVNQARQLAK